jgi:hypothetical protein
VRAPRRLRAVGRRSAREIPAGETAGREDFERRRPRYGDCGAGKRGKRRGEGGTVSEARGAGVGRLIAVGAGESAMGEELILAERLGMEAEGSEHGQGTGRE